jgi:hypothetical protein
MPPQQLVGWRRPLGADGCELRQGGGVAAQQRKELMLVLRVRIALRHLVLAALVVRLRQ